VLEAEGDDRDELLLANLESIQELAEIRPYHRFESVQLVGELLGLGVQLATDQAEIEELVPQRLCLAFGVVGRGREEEPVVVRAWAFGSNFMAANDVLVNLVSELSGNAKQCGLTIDVSEVTVNTTYILTLASCTQPHPPLSCEPVQSSWASPRGRPS
jgi:hypothetical protein